MSDLGGEVKEIEGHTFDVGYLNTKVARKTWLKLMQAVGPAFAHAQDGKLDAAVTALASKPELAPFFEELVTTLAKVTMVDGKSLAQCEGEVFKGKIGLTFKWLRFALEVNFKDFLDMLADLMGREAPKEA